MVHTGRAVVFENIDDFHARINDENLDVDETCVLVLKNCGPRATLAWPRWAICPYP
jgi:dihydroxyacid dehydratase/phosphogluconate dehydratase